MRTTMNLALYWASRAEHAHGAVKARYLGIAAGLSELALANLPDDRPKTRAVCANNARCLREKSLRAQAVSVVG